MKSALERGCASKTLAVWHLRPEVTAALLFEPRDMWTGLYWDVRYDDRWNGYMWRPHRRLYVWICLVPLMTLRLGLPWPGKELGA